MHSGAIFTIAVKAALRCNCSHVGKNDGIEEER